MIEKERCVYCGNKITKKSKEHIIQNAIGGLYESDEICCDICNGFLSKILMSHLREHLIA